MQLLQTELFDQNYPKDFNLYNHSNDNPIDCFLEIDLDYPDELHDLRNDYPLVGEKIKLTNEMLSEYQLQIIEDNSSHAENKKTYS